MDRQSLIDILSQYSPQKSYTTMTEAKLEDAARACCPFLFGDDAGSTTLDADIPPPRPQYEDRLLDPYSPPRPQYQDQLLGPYSPPTTVYPTQQQQQNNTLLPKNVDLGALLRRIGETLPLQMQNQTLGPNNVGTTTLVTPPTKMLQPVPKTVPPVTNKGPVFRHPLQFQPGGPISQPINPNKSPSIPIWTDTVTPIPKVGPTVVPVVKSTVSQPPTIVIPKPVPIKVSQPPVVPVGKSTMSQPPTIVIPKPVPIKVSQPPVVPVVKSTVSQSPTIVIPATVHVKVSQPPIGVASNPIQPIAPSPVIETSKLIALSPSESVVDTDVSVSESNLDERIDKTH
jgi:hypothetical protein